MDNKFNWSKHIEQFDQHSKQFANNSKQNKFNYENVDSNSKCCRSGSRTTATTTTNRDRLNRLNRCLMYRESRSHSPVNVPNKLTRNSKRTISTIEMHRPHSIMSHTWMCISISILICFINLINCDSTVELPISHPSISRATRSTLIYSTLDTSRTHSTNNLVPRTVRASKHHSIVSLKRRLKKRSNSPSAYNANSNLNNNLNSEDLSSETIELRSNQLSSARLTGIDNSPIVNNSIDSNETSSDTKSTVIDKSGEFAVDSNSTNSKQDAKLKEEQEDVLKRIDEINGGHVCSLLNKPAHFNTKGTQDATKESRDKKYYLLVKALEPKFIKLPVLAAQSQPSSAIKTYYRELIEKLELITSILYDNVEQINASQHLQLMRKIIREIATLHPHILRARLISLNLNNEKAYRRRRHSSAFSIDFDQFDDYNVDLEDDKPNSVDVERQQTKLINLNDNNVPFRRRSIRERSDVNDRLNVDNDDQISEQGKPATTEQWLRAKDVFFYMRGEHESVHEFQDVTLTTNRDHVSWLDIVDVDERSGTIKEFDQLLTLGHLFVMSEKERLFSGYTGIYFDCAMRRWLLSYTSLLVSCNQCSTTKKQSTSSVDELEMRLIGLLSVDIDLETVDLNQCDASKLDPMNNFEQLNKKTAESTDQRKGAYPTDNRLNNQLKSSAQQFDRPSFERSLVQNRFQLNSLDHQTNDQIESRSQFTNLQYNDSSLVNQPQRLVNNQPSSSFASISDHSSPADKVYKLSASNDKLTNRLMLHFEKTNKCHQATSQCHFVPNHGIRKGGYVCKCKKGYFAVLHQFSGLEVERAWDYQFNQKPNALEKAHTYDRMYICKKCSEGCNTCVDASPCLSKYNWAFRTALLTISILCICLIFLLTYYIYKYRKIKIFKVASPVFLSLTLLGCSIMYAEMIFIFPVLSTGFCIMTKITRHMGFCLTYSALLLKTWRVSLTYRVKSAHKLKLTDRQLLQWLFPILLVMTIFLGTWIISDPPKEIIIQDWNKLKFAICEYNWFDHSIAIGEFLFLLWGIKVCYNVRNAESFFNEAKYITWAIYNIAAVNILMILIHIMILPNAGPDLKYFLGFVRTQLSTTTTILLIFGPKFYRLIKGEGDVWDAKIRARRGINASFSLNGVGVVHEELTDLYQENEELKEQVHKLATQVELMRLRQMQVNNRHLKSKHNIGSGANSQALSSSVVVNSANVTGLVGLAAANVANTAGSHFHSYSYNQLNPQVDSAGIGLVTGLVGGVVGGTGVGVGLTFSPNQPTACQRISPAAELQSEKV